MCELHFQESCFVRDLEAELTGRPVRRRLKEGAVPTPGLGIVRQDSVSLAEVVAKVTRARQIPANQIEISAGDVPSSSKTNQDVLRTDSNSVHIAPKSSSTCSHEYKSQNCCRENEALKARVKQLEGKLVTESKDKVTHQRRLVRLESRVNKLKSTVSKLRKERRQYKQREYMRKSKREKALEKRKERRAWVLQNIQTGKLDKTALSMVNSRKIIQSMKLSQLNKS